MGLEDERKSGLGGITLVWAIYLITLKRKHHCSVWALGNFILNCYCMQCLGKNSLFLFQRDRSLNSLQRMREAWGKVGFFPHGREAGKGFKTSAMAHLQNQPVRCPCNEQILSTFWLLGFWVHFLFNSIEVCPLWFQWIHMTKTVGTKKNGECP